MSSQNGSDAGQVGGGTPAPAPAPAPAHVSVRLATREDMQHIYDMIHELAQYENMPEGPRISVDDLVRDGFESSPEWFFVLVAECEGEVLGHALCNRAYSSWTGRAYYIEDLFVKPVARRRGVGLRLLQHLCQMAENEGVQRVDWHVLASNAPALAFYTRLGARDLGDTEGRAAMRLDHPHIHNLAHTHTDATPTPTTT